MNANGPNQILVAIGSNLGDSRQNVLNAFARLQQFALGAIKTSSIWRSTPIDCPPGSPMFLNAAVAFQGRPEITPESLLLELQGLEQDFGRTPKKLLNEARPLDLDIIAFGNETRSGPNLILPHPRAHERRFVLQPLSEIVPELVLPGQQQTIRELLLRLPEDPELRKLP